MSHTPFIMPSAPMPTTPFDGEIFKSYLNQINEKIHQKIMDLGLSATEFMDDSLALRTQAVDNVLTVIFKALQLDDKMTLFAVGGYGRGELFPYSDVDILILADDADKYQGQIERFVAHLWDIGITPAIFVHDMASLHAGMNEPSFATAVLDARFIVGSTDLKDVPRQTLAKLWTTEQFYHVKLTEAKERHLSHHATEYALEPNIKNGVGGLRDIHIIHWLHRFYGLHHTPITDLNIHHHTPTLDKARRFFWLVRHHLHTLSARANDVIHFDKQSKIAERLGLSANPNQPNGHAEALMRQYYHHAMTTASLSELICDDFVERYLGLPSEWLVLDDDFYQMVGKDGTQIAIQDMDLFTKKPSAILGIFLAMGKFGIKKIQASTLTALSLAVPLIDNEYRNNPVHKALFLANLQENNYLFHRLRLMKRFGVLGAYLPAFGQIMGLSQYDLFHRYTVDAHTLYLIRILHRFGDLDNDEYQQKFELVSQIYQHIHRKDILTIASLFHDIAKGRGGDHSELGAVDVYEFCVNHGMSVDDSEFCAWLVRHHLTMSLTAQKKDIYDPDVIGQFAQFVGNITRLNHLYVLTVADMNATNSQLWNTWRASLLKQLYISTHKALTGQMGDPDTIIQTRKANVQAISQIPKNVLDELWQGFGNEYFLTQKSTDIAWQTTEILNHAHTLADTPIISLRPHSDLALDAMLLFVCVPDQEYLFATSVCVLDKYGLSVLDANILTACIGDFECALDTYIVIDRFAKRDEKGSLISDFLTDQYRQNELKLALCHAFVHQDCQVATSLENPTLRHFNVPVTIDISPATSHAHAGLYVLNLIAKDRLGLLAKVGQVFRQHDIKVHKARITTMGERAEDVFYISDDKGMAFDDDRVQALQAQLVAVLS